MREYIKKNKTISRSIMFLIGLFLISINYNLLTLPNNFVTGGASGVSVILNKLFNFDPVTTIYVLNISLLIISYIFIDKKYTYHAIIGSLLYPFAISITLPLANVLRPFFEINNYLITVILDGIFLGVGTGLIYKAGFSTGGGDIMMKLINKYFKISEGKAALINNIIILLLSGFVFGFYILIYSAIIILINSEIVDRILIGISDSKLFFVYTKKVNQIKDYILNDMNTGLTLLNTEGGYKNKQQVMLMVVVPTNDYYRFKDAILSIDSDAFFVVSDCYEVNGGKKRKNLPFI